MSDPPAAIERTRLKASSIMAAVVADIQGQSESAVRDGMSARIESDSEMYKAGWYDPPPGGYAVLFAKKPFDRLKYDTLRDSRFFPRDDIQFTEETVAQLHLCPIDRASNLFGDFGCTIYRGADEQIQTHLKQVRDLIVDVANHAHIGMSFSELFEYSQVKFGEHQKVIAWMSTVHDTMKVNLGHTVPGSYGESISGTTLSEVKEYIQTHRVFINANQTFRIPETCAFTVEARLTDPTLTLPNAYFHVIVRFSNGEKTVLTNFGTVFEAAGMDFML